jgi:hypothetical protein
VRLSFDPWKSFVAYRDRIVTQLYLHRIASNAESEFRKGIASKKSGRVYRRKGRNHRASAPGEFPARDSGAHLASVSSSSNGQEANVGSGMFYAKFLRDGTSKMAKRKMSREALLLAIDKDKEGVGHFMRFK